MKRYPSVYVKVNLESMIHDVNENNSVIKIDNKDNNAILISQSNYDLIMNHLNNNTSSETAKQLLDTFGNKKAD